MYFFALSHAPAVLLMPIANCTPETSAPVREPAVLFLPKKLPARKVRTSPKASGQLFPSGKSCGDPDEPVVIRGLASLQKLVELQTALCHHVLCCIANGRHGHGAEGEGGHGTQQQASEGLGCSTTTVAMTARTVYAPKSARLTSAADPMAKPLPMAAVVLYAASKASVIFTLPC